MEETATPQPTILPPQETPEMYGVPAEVGPVQAPASSSVSQLLKKFIPFIAIFGILLIILVVSSVFMKQSPAVIPVISITPTPSGTTEAISSRTISYFATGSAFMQYDASVEDLPKKIQEAVVQDPTALPPILDLPLGFSN